MSAWVHANCSLAAATWWGTSTWGYRLIYDSPISAPHKAWVWECIVVSIQGTNDSHFLTQLTNTAFIFPFSVLFKHLAWDPSSLRYLFAQVWELVLAVRCHQVPMITLKPVSSWCIEKRRIDDSTQVLCMTPLFRMIWKHEMSWGSAGSLKSL